MAPSVTGTTSDAIADDTLVTEMLADAAAGAGSVTRRGRRTARTCLWVSPSHPLHSSFSHTSSGFKTSKAELVAVPSHRLALYMITFTRFCQLRLAISAVRCTL